MRRNTILLVALFAGAIAAAPQTQPTLKNRLGQMSAKNLAQVENVSAAAGASAESSSSSSAGASVSAGAGGDFSGCQVPADLGSIQLGSLECPCNFTQLPGLGAGLSQAFEQRAEATQVSNL